MNALQSEYDRKIVEINNKHKNEIEDLNAKYTDDMDKAKREVASLNKNLKKQEQVKITCLKIKRK